jgi:HK97 family phage major capsid protein
MSRLRTLRDRRGQLVQQIRELANQAGENALTAEQRANYDKLFADQTSVAEEIRREEQLADAERELVTTEFRAGRGANGNGERPEQRTTEGLTDEELRAIDAEIDESDDGIAAAAVQSHQTRRRSSLGMVREQLRATIREQRANPRAATGYRNAFRTWLRAGMAAVSAEGQRALQAGTGAEGGYLVAPMQTAAGLIIALTNQLFIRQLATVVTVPTAASLGIVSLDTDPDDADWTSEIATGSEDSGTQFGKRQMTPHPLAKRIKISNKLLRMAAGVEQLIVGRLAYKFAVAEEKAFLTGSGAGRPLGLFTASADGVPTTRDVSTGMTSSAVTSAGVINVKYAVRAGYRRNAGWLFHRDAIKQIALLTDTTNVPLWLPSIRQSEPDTLLGHPIYESEYVPNTFTSGLYVGLFGDFSQYQIADALDMQFQRLNELYAETNQTGIIGRKETDGQPVLSEAFARVKLG